MDKSIATAAAGVLLLAGSSLALADDWKDRDGWRGERWERRDFDGRHWERRDWDDGWRRGPPPGHWRKHQHYHYHYHEYAPRWEPRPDYEWHRESWGPARYGYDDSVTIILQGRLN
jgi:hypothetical protein